MLMFSIGGPELLVILCLLFIPLSMVVLGIVVAWLIGKRRASRRHRCPHCGGEFTEEMEVQAGGSDSAV